MHQHQLSNWQHPHNFALINHKGEVRAKWVLILTLSTMIVEIVAGMRFHSMALLADGWHMATHVLAFLIAIFAFRYIRIHAQDDTFAFSPAKVSVLGGFASSIALAMIAFIMMVESVKRGLQPESISFDEAIFVAGIGLAINLLSAIVLDDHSNEKEHHHQHSHDHSHHHHSHHDHNLRAAYLHVIADAMTSVFAIIALLAGKYFGWDWLDAVMGFVGGIIIIIWARGLINETSPVLIDKSVDLNYQQAIKDVLQSDGECMVTDLHIWRLAPAHQAAIIGILTRYPKSPDYYKSLLHHFNQLDHITVEVNVCSGDECKPV